MTNKKVDYNAVFDKMDKLKSKIKECCPQIKDESGIYFMLRESGGFKFAYIGQSCNMLTRLAQHLDGHTQHIDLSIKAHGLYSENNKDGWRIYYKYFSREELDEKERLYIHLYANAGYQMRNKTTGGQDDKKEGISQNKSGKTYREGVEYGEKKAIRLIKQFFDKYLDYLVKEPCNKIKERKIKEFENLLKGEQENV